VEAVQPVHGTSMIAIDRRRNQRRSGCEVLTASETVYSHATHTGSKVGRPRMYR
jgi:hypothetical protein